MTTTDGTDAVPGRLERRKARTRAAILAAAGALFRQRGYDQTSVQQVAEAADTGVGTVYGYFASKEELLRCVLDAHSEEAIQRYRAAVGERTPAIDRICRALDTLASYILENRTILMAAYGSAGRTARVDAVPGEWLFAAFRRLIAGGIERGELRSVPVDTTARVLVGTYTAAMLGVGVWRPAQDDPAVRMDLERLVRALLEPARS